MPCCVGRLLVRLRADRPELARGLEDAMAEGLPASAIAKALADHGYPDYTEPRINHHRHGRCRNCPAKS
jgi:hypothetical protein